MRALRFAVMAIMAMAMTAAFAQSPSSQPADKPPGAPASRPRPMRPHNDEREARPVDRKPASAEMQKLQFLLGEWRTAETFEPSEFAPKGGTGHGQARFHWGAEKKFLLENYQSRNTVAGHFAGHAILWYDPKTKAYRSFWCDGMMGCEDSFGSGRFDGDKLIFEGEHEFQGKKMKGRLTIYDIKPDSFGWMEEVSVEGGPMKKTMSLQHTRIAGREQAPGTPPEAKPETKK